MRLTAPFAVLALAASTVLATVPSAYAAPAAPAPAAAPATDGATPPMPSGRTDYRTLADYQSDMDRLAERHPNLVKKVTLPHRTTEGRPVTGIEVTRDAHRADGKPVLMITGMHHGNEWASGEVTMEFAFDLLKNHGRDKTITRLLDRVRVLFVPVVNVDGFVLNTRRTATNTDMNRNYGFGWSPSEPFPGTGPWSEPESRNVRDAISSRQVTTFLTMHTCLANILYPPLQLKAGLPQDIDAFRAFAGALGNQNGYYHTTSAEDYETAGEAIDWSYYATRGLGVTVEVCTNPPTGLPRTWQTLVPEQYWGIDAVRGKGNRGAFLVALRQAADRAQHSVITGEAPKGAVLTVTKGFDMWTNPIPQPDGTSRPVSFAQRLTSTMRSDGGRFTWHVNPSIRPEPPYQADGVHGDRAGRFLRESWTLTCARPDGKVLQTVKVTVDRGESKRVNLNQCRKLWHRH